MPSHMSLVEPLRPECPSCTPIRAVVLSWTKSTTRRHASRCSSFHSPGQPGVIRPSGDTHVISVITRPAPPSAFEPRWTRWNSSGTPSVAQYMSIGERIDAVLQLELADAHRLEHRRRDRRSPPWWRANSASIRAAKSRVALLEVLEGDPARPGQQVEDELGRRPGRRTSRCSRTTPARPARRAASTPRPACARSGTPRAPPPASGARAGRRPARARPPWPAWCRSRWRSGRCARRRRAARRCRRASARCARCGS